MNVVVIRVDQLRRSALPCYGNTESIAPAIGNLAIESEVFTKAYATEPVCSASRSSFDVGKHTHALSNSNKLHPNDRTIHGLLQACGVDTFNVGKWHKTPDYLKSQQKPEKVPASILRGWNYHAGHEQKHDTSGGPYWENGVGPEYTSGSWRPQTHVDLFLARLAQATPPFYGVLDLEIPHGPLIDIIGTAWDVFAPSGVTLQPNVPPAVASQAATDLALYYGMLYSVDAMVSQVLSALASGGYLADTVVIFTSDHGSHLGAFGLIDPEEQKRSLYPEATDIPLLIRWPGGPTGENATPIGTCHMLPLILGIFGVEHGTGLHANVEPEGLYFEQVDGSNAPDGAWRGIIVDGHRYARSEGSSGPWVLFEESDTYCQTNLVGQGNPLEAAMQSALEAAASALGDTIPW